MLREKGEYIVLLSYFILLLRPLGGVSYAFAVQEARIGSYVLHEHCEPVACIAMITAEAIALASVVITLSATRTVPPGLIA